MVGYLAVVSCLNKSLIWHVGPKDLELVPHASKDLFGDNFQNPPSKVFKDL